MKKKRTNEAYKANDEELKNKKRTSKDYKDEEAKKKQIKRIDKAYKKIENERQCKRKVQKREFCLRRFIGLFGGWNGVTHTKLS